MKKSILALGLITGILLTEVSLSAGPQAPGEQEMKEVLPEAVRFEPAESDTLYFKAYDKDNQLLGACFTVQARGYSGAIETLAGMYINGTIAAIKVVEQNETPGVGGRIAESAFAGQFMNKNNLDGVHAITGATISSKAVIDSVKEKAAKIKVLLQQGSSL